MQWVHFKIGYKYMNGVILFFLQARDCSDLTGLYSDQERRDSIDCFSVNAQYDAFEPIVSCWENLLDQFEHYLDFPGRHRHLPWLMVLVVVFRNCMSQNSLRC